MKINSSTLEALRKSFSLIFQQGYGSVEPWSRQLSVRVPSGGKSNVYGWLQAMPIMREWVGDRQIQNIAESAFEITNKDYELTIGVDRNDIEDDNLGVYGPMLQGLGEADAKNDDYLIVSLLQNGNTALCSDGQYFFDTDHPVSQFDSSLGTQQNYWSSGKALTLDNYVAVRAAMMGFLGENNKPLGVMPDLLVVPPQLGHIARQITMSDLIVNTAGATPAAGAAGMRNVMAGTARVLEVPELAGAATTWYLLATNRTMKPFVVQERRASDFMHLGPGSEHGQKSKKYLFGVDKRGAAGYGLWFQAAKCVA